MEVVFSILYVILFIVGILAFFVSLMFYKASEDDYPVIKEFQIKCPQCQDLKHERIQRKWWMRLIPGTKRYRCNKCNTKFMIIFWRRPLTVS